MFDLNRGRRVERNLTRSTLQLNNAFSFSLSSYIRDNVGFSTSTTMSMSLSSVFSCRATEPKIPSFVMPNWLPNVCLNSDNLPMQSWSTNIICNILRCKYKDFFWKFQIFKQISLSFKDYSHKRSYSVMTNDKWQFRKKATEGILRRDFSYVFWVCRCRYQRRPPPKPPPGRPPPGRPPRAPGPPGPPGPRPPKMLLAPPKRFRR